MERFEFKTEGEKRLDSFLREVLPVALGEEVSNSKIRRFIMAGQVFAGGRQCRIPSFVLRPGTVVSISVDREKLFFEKKPDDIDFVLDESNVLYEDDVIIVVNKPAFLPTEGTIVESRKSMHSAVVDYLWKKNPSLRNPPYAGIMHRLDRETSGVLLFTKSRAVNNAVHDMFENHTATKRYRAVSFSRNSGAVPVDFVCDNFIGRISAKSAQCKNGLLPESRGGKHARTEFHVDSIKNGYVFIDCTLFTGRTHQIRVHLSQKGLPICGDELYGGSNGFSENGGRIMLHAFSLEFPHPVTGKLMKVESPLPELFF